MVRSIWIAGGVAVLALVAARQAAAQTQTQSIERQATAHGGAVTSHVSATATVQAVDTGARTVTLVIADGKHVTVEAPADADLGNIRPGDKVDVDYQEGLAVEVKPPGTPVSGPTESTGVQRTVRGAAGLREVTAVAEVVAVDPSHNQVTFRGPKGDVQTVGVQDPQMQQRARSLKPGDKVQFKYTLATAVSLRPRKQQPQQPVQPGQQR